MSNAPILLTPGPLTTSIRTRQAMLVDWGSWDRDFNQLTASVCEQLLAIIDGSASHHCVPCKAAAPSPWKRPSAPWCRVTARSWC